MPSFKVSTQPGGRGWRAGVWVELARFCHLGGAAEISAKASSIDNNRHCWDSHPQNATAASQCTLSAVLSAPRCQPDARSALSVLRCQQTADRGALACEAAAHT